MKRRTGPGSSVLWFAVVAVTGLGVRLAYLLQTRASDPLFFHPQMDALYHHQWALAISAGTEFIRDAFFRAPLYPYFLALLYKLTGTDLFWTRILQALLGSASCGLVYSLARQVFRVGRDQERREDSGLTAGTREWVARMSGLVMAGYPMAFYFDGELLIPVLLVFLVLLGMVLLYRSMDRDRQWYLPGLAFGLAAIARPNVLVFVAGSVVWLFLRHRGQAWKHAGLLAAGTLAAVLPVTVRNLAASGYVVPVAWQAGTNFYIGNNPESDGVTAVLPGTRASWWGGYNDVRGLAERAEGRELKGAEVDRYWLRRGFEFWLKSPGRALVLTLRKFYLLLSGYEVSNNRDIYFARRYSMLKLLVHNLPFLKFPFGVLLPLALAGMVMAGRLRRRLVPVLLFLGTYGLSFVVFFVTARFRMPTVPFLIILAAYATTRVLRMQRRLLLIPGIVFTAAFLLLNVNLAGTGRSADMAQNHLTAAMGLHQSGRVSDALNEVRQALAFDSASNVLTLEATLLLETGRQTEAEQAALAAVRVAPDDADALGTAGNVYAASGLLSEARRFFEESVRLDPYSVQSWTNLGNVALSRRDSEMARRYYTRALEVDPAYPAAHFHLGLLDYYEGRKTEARARWEKTIRLDPSFDKARQALNNLR